MSRNEPRATSDFYETLPAHADFSRLADPSVYTPVPEDWSLGLADIVGSTEAIAAGRYKAVNTAAAAVIAAVSNALPARQIPFVFGGDGASFAVGPEDAAAGTRALASVAPWIAAHFGLTMRVAMAPVGTLRAEGFDLRLARFSVSPDLSYAMFSGGGLAFAEARMKAGDFTVAPGTANAPPDLTGLSCRFSEIPSRKGVILSLIMVPAAGTDPAAFGRIATALLKAVAGDEGDGHPVPPSGPALAFTRAGFLSEMKTDGAKSGRSSLRSTATVAVRWALAYLVLASKREAGGFQPRRYMEELVRNSDFRKFDDGLRMTLDCSPSTAGRIEAVLQEAMASGAIVYGCHRQEAALMTCFVPSATRSDHVHFVDGASGGYALAAQAMKRRQDERTGCAPATSVT